MHEPDKLTHVIAVDGLAASGKGTLAKKLAEYYNLPYLDTGRLYRQFAILWRDQGFSATLTVMTARDLAAQIPQHDFSEAQMLSETVSKDASFLEAQTPVRKALIDQQKQFALQQGGAVLDGRDIGTVIAPNAVCKLFITATPAVRAKRRLLQLQQQGKEGDYLSILTAIKERDSRDINRVLAPLKPASDALVIDSTELTALQVYKLAQKAATKAGFKK